MITSHGLQYQYPAGPTLAFPGMKVPRGGVLLLRGRSGSGKSTWLALAAGLLTASHGTLTVAGQLLGALKPIARDACVAWATGRLAKDSSAALKAQL